MKRSFLEIPKRTLGKTGVEVTCLGLGGEGVLRTFGREREARDVIARALELGVNYFESARAYSGSEGYYGQVLGERRREIFLASKSHDRTAEGARRHLETTLANLQTDWLDLWQVHDVRSEEDLAEIFGRGGAIEAFDRAKKEGKVRFVGVTGHQDPAILLKAFDLYDFDTVLMPVNPAEAAWLSFPALVLPEARRRGMGVVGMKVLCRGLGLRVPGCGEATPWLRYALGHDVSTVVIGCDDPAQVERNVAAAGRAPLAAAECEALEATVAPWALELMYYK
jgi:aryl-alcohol dehydrogenase-like predicted oxidoreductase